MGTCLEPGTDCTTLPLDFPHDPTIRVSDEAIYQALFIKGRGALRRELTACLRSGRVLQVPRAHGRVRQELRLPQDHARRKLPIAPYPAFGKEI
jgi:hypothetical protein